MLDFPKLDNCTYFPLSEGTNLEFKGSFTSCKIEKIYTTICAILNSGGGYIVIGVEDENRYIVGIKKNKIMDNFLLSLDSIYHSNIIKLQDGSSIPLGTIKSETVTAADSKEVLVITCTPIEDQKYTKNDGSIYHRLAASNFRQTALPTIYSETELDIIVNDRLQKEKALLQSHYDSERNKLKAKFRNLEKDFECVFKNATDIEHNFNEFREMIFNNIQLQKVEAETKLTTQPKFSFYSLFSCCG